MAERTQKATPSHVFSHWFQMIEGFSAQPTDLYKSVDQQIRARSLPDVKASRVTCHEGGLLSAKRVYLRVVRKGKIFDICGAPFGKGFFVSWWLGDKPPGFLGRMAESIARIPIIGVPFQTRINPTYYQIDTTLMFQQAVHAAVTDAVDEMTKAQGLRPLTELEKKPIMNL